MKTQNKKLKAMFCLSGLLIGFDSKGFNVFYHGDNAEEAYEIQYFTGCPRELYVKEDYIRDFKLCSNYIEDASLLMDISNINAKGLPYPYCTLNKILPFKAFGSHYNSEFLKKLIEKNNVVNVIEIGSLFGLSARQIVYLLPKNGMLYAIDIWPSDIVNDMYEQFLSNVIHVGLTDKIIPIKKRSDEAVDQIRLHQKNFDLIYIDGDHSTEGVLKDLDLYYPLLSDHGIICGDDWLIKSVRAGVVEFAMKRQLTIYKGCTFWFLKDEGSYQQKSFLDADNDVWIF